MDLSEYRLFFKVLGCYKTCVIVCDYFFPFFDFILETLFLFLGGDSWDGRAQGRKWQNCCCQLDFLSLRCTAEFSLTRVVFVA